MWKKKQESSQHQICRQSIRHQKFIWEHHIWCHVKISKVATLVSMIPNFWCYLEVAATELHLCFVIKSNVWWKRTFPMASIAVLHHKHMKLFKSFTPHVIAWSVRKSFNQSIRRAKEQKTRLQSLAWAMTKSVMPPRAMKSAKLPLVQVCFQCRAPHFDRLQAPCYLNPVPQWGREFKNVGNHWVSQCVWCSSNITQCDRKENVVIGVESL